VIPSYMCMLCKHLNADRKTCAAFPSGIPATLIQESFDHRKAYPGDHGIRFEPRKREKKPKP
jgi:hypothetical protein